MYFIIIVTIIRKTVDYFIDSDFILNIMIFGWFSVKFSVFILLLDTFLQYILCRSFVSFKVAVIVHQFPIPLITISNFVYYKLYE